MSAYRDASERFGSAMDVEQILAAWWLFAAASFWLVRHAVYHVPSERAAVVLTLVPSNLLLTPLALEFSRLWLLCTTSGGLEQDLAFFGILGVLGGLFGLVWTLALAPPWRAPWSVNAARLCLAGMGTCGALLTCEVATRI